MATGFLLACLAARRDVDSQAAAFVREAIRIGGVDWDACRRVAAGQRLEPLLLAALGGRAILPRPLEEQWRQAYLKNAGRAELYFRELAAILAALQDAGIPAILLKGAGLALTVYEEPALRPMADLDLLLHRADVPAALSALAAAGYTMPVPELGIAGALEYTNEFVLTRPGGLEIPLELHWGLFDSSFYGRSPAFEAWLWEAALPVTVAGIAARVLGPEAQLLHLCGHLALHHGGEGLLWLNDIAEVVRRYEGAIDWEGLPARAQAAELVLPLREILPRVATGWAAPVPAEALARLMALEPSAAEARTYGRMRAGTGPVASEVWAKLGGLAPRRGVRYLAGKLFPAPAYMRQRYRLRHPALLPLAYPYRWLLGARSAAAFLTRPRSETP